MSAFTYLPIDILAYVASFLEARGLMHFDLVNKSINRHPLIKKLIFRLRLVKHVNCRQFMPRDVAKNKLEEYKKSFGPGSTVTSNIGAFAGLLICDYEFVGSKIFFDKGVNGGYFVFILSLDRLLPYDVVTNDRFNQQIIDMYPYKNLTKDKFYCYDDGRPSIEITYDYVPEKYVTIEQAENDIKAYYRILKEKLRIH